MSLPPQAIKFQKMHVKDDRTKEIIAVSMVLFALAVVAVILRLLSRKLTGMKLKADDWLILVALVVVGGLCFQVFPGMTAHPAHNHEFLED